MNHIFSLSLYNDYVLEVADTNTNGETLEQLGYKAFIRVKQRNSKISGIN
ncbi:hypothetical protein [Cytobacillus purgationiresistens]|uniref:Uncharacterized protein n=1 Tax=Cytobacillus purgationiresistens TaxID=863449 RepID=A0ABU0ABZ4_9BACI|nr:hypothetical protein [Cytobacillus purgationiresistens]MDQ0268399.1 hypothetical protein [Cytobacillus purgationiresistens]